MNEHVEIARLVVRHGATVLADVDGLRLEAGRALTIVGESGSGKSVLAHALMGTLPPELSAEGSMTVGGERFDLADRRGRRALWGRELALLPQEPALALDPTMRVRAQVAEGAPGWRPRDRQALLLADDRLARSGLGGAGSRYPHTLSGGMAQRVAYVAATIGGARILIVDEPSKGLDPDALGRLADLLRAHLEGGGLLLTITHDLRLARRLGGAVLVMQEASLVETGPVDTVLDRPTHPYTRRLVDAEPGRWRYPWTQMPPVRGGEPVVRAEGIGASYGDQSVFTDLDLTIGAGERWAVSGPSGVGKTTLGNALLGLVPIDRGTITRAPAAVGRMQKLYQDPVLSFPARVPLGAGLEDVVRRHGAPADRVSALLERLGLSPALLHRRPGQVSGGELQRIAIARAALTRPALVFADEATSRLDLATQAVTTDLLVTELAEQGAALLMVTHDPDLARAVAPHRLTMT